MDTQPITIEPFFAPATVLSQSLNVMPVSRFIVSALFVALPVLALGALFSRAMDAHGAPLASVEQVRRGMRPEKVKEILGTPNWSGQWNDGTAGGYHRFLVLCRVTVVFSPDDLLLETEHDH